MLRVFVYGTLQPGERFHLPYCGDRVRVEGEALASGRLYHLPQLNYPAMTREPGWVRGVVLSFDDPQAILKLDTLEGFVGDRDPASNEYNRYEVEVFDAAEQSRSFGVAWAYYMSSEKVRQYGGIWLPGGLWREAKLRELGIELR